MKLLKQSTQHDIIIGPLLDNTDYKTPEEAVAYNAAGIDVDVIIDGATKIDVTLAGVVGDGYWRHVANGYYALTLGTAHTGTTGPLRVTFEAAGVLPCWEEFTVVPAHVFDALITGTDYLFTDVRKISNSSVAADAVEANIGYLDASIAGLNDPSANDIATAVWGSATRTLTSFGTLVDDVALAVWGSTARTLTGFGTLVADIWAYASRTLTSFGTLTTDIDTQLSGQHGLGSWESNTLTAADVDTELTANHGAGSWQAGGGLAASDVWTYPSRELTGFGTLVADVASAVWASGTRTLTGFGTLIADIWAYAARTLTGFGTLVDEVDAELSTNHGSGSWQTSALTASAIDTELTANHGTGSWQAADAGAVWSHPTRTLTSFGTLTADIATQVWAHGTRTLTSFGTLIANIWTHDTRTLTSFGTLPADVDTELSVSHGAGSWEGGGSAPTVEDIDAQLSATHGAGSWLGTTPAAVWGYSARTLTSFGTLIADIWAYVTRTLTGFGTLASDVDTQLSGTHGAGSWEGGGAGAPTVEEIDAELTANHGGGSWQTYAGTGGVIKKTYLLTEPPEGSGTPIPDAYVMVTTDEAGQNYITDGRTNQFGEVTFWLNVGTYYFWRHKAGYVFENPDIEEVTG